jgi:CubicO group peptidase (beta-lactamase class C family)
MPSLAKAFTATAVAMLVDDGRIAWDDPVVLHLPHFRVRDTADTRDIRIRDILSHRTGY